MKASFSYYRGKNKTEHWTIYHFNIMLTKMIQNKKILGSKEIPMLEFQLKEGTYASCSTMDDDGRQVIHNYSDAKFRESDILFENSRIRYLIIEE